MAISVHGRATVDDSMLLYRRASIRSFSSIPYARGSNKTHQPPKMPNHVVTMADAQSRGW